VRYGGTSRSIRAIRHRVAIHGAVMKEKKRKRTNQNRRGEPGSRRH